MTKFTIYSTLLLLMILGTGVHAQDTTAEPPGAVPDLTGTWITQSGNIVEVTLSGTDVRMYFPYYQKNMTASFNGTVLVYVTHYNDPTIEECYLDVPDSELEACRRFIHIDDERHRFTLSLSEDGQVLSGVKEINVMHCEWDTDENGRTSNYRPIGYQWEYDSDYQWRRANCDFAGLPPLTGIGHEKYELLNIMFDKFSLREEFSLGDFQVIDRVRFEYSQNYIDADDGEYVPNAEAQNHQHLEPLDGGVYLDPETGLYKIEIYPYAMESYVNLLSGLTILCNELQALESLDEPIPGPTTAIELESVNYAWSHRQALCTLDDELFNHHIDFLSRALRLREMAED
ncbi:MAG: hypothetical protein NTY09_02340 [bacterium]|nr:hypothetical protein [bacterium]